MAAATWDFTPTVSGSVEYTDNVRGTTSGAESDLIFTAQPGFGIRGTGARLRLNFNANFRAQHYLDTEDSGDFNTRFLGAASAELIENRLFVDASTSYRPSTINRLGPIAASDRDLGSNQSDVMNVRVSPLLRLNVGRWASSQTRLTAAQTMYNVLDENDDPAAGTTSDSTVLSASQVFSSGSKFQKFGWALSGSHTRTRRESGTTNTGAGDTFKRSNVEASVSYAVYRWLTPNLRVGMDRFSDNSLGGGSGRDGAYWLAGVNLRPGPRTRLDFSMGRRFDDVSYDGSFSYRASRAVNIRASYSETVTTAQELEADPFQFVDTDEFGNLIDTRTGLPIEPGDPAFDQTFTDVVFRSRTFRMGLSGSRLRNSYSISWFVSRRDTDGSATPRDTTVAGVSGTVGRDLTPDLRLSFNGSYTDTADNAAADSRRYLIGASLNYSLSETLRTGLSVRHLKRTTEGTGDTDLSENSVVVTVRKTF